MGRSATLSTTTKHAPTNPLVANVPIVGWIRLCAWVSQGDFRDNRGRQVPMLVADIDCPQRKIVQASEHFTAIQRPRHHNGNVNVAVLVPVPTNPATIDQDIGVWAEPGRSKRVHEGANRANRCVPIRRRKAIRTVECGAMPAIPAADAPRLVGDGIRFEGGNSLWGTASIRSEGANQRFAPASSPRSEPRNPIQSVPLDPATKSIANRRS